MGNGITSQDLIDMHKDALRGLVSDLKGRISHYKAKEASLEHEEWWRARRVEAEEICGKVEEILERVRPE